MITGVRKINDTKGRKIVMLLIAILLLTIGHAQNNIIKKQFTTSKDGLRRWGYQSLPDSFNLDARKYPIIFFFHGVGERAWPDKADINALSKLSSKGSQPFLTTIGSKFIYVAIQDEYWSPNVAEVYYVLLNDPQFKDRINGVFYTGHSAGGQQVEFAITTNQAMSDTIKGMVSASAPSYNKTGIQFAKGKPSLFFCDPNDPGYGDSKELASGIGAAATFIDTHTGHDNTDEAFNPASKHIIEGKSQNIYDWMLSKITTVIIPPPTTVTGVQIGTTTINGVTYKIIQ